MNERVKKFGPALLTLGLIGAVSAPAFADAYASDDRYVRETYTTTTVRPGYGFNGAYEEMRREMAHPVYYHTPTYTWTPSGYVYTSPVTTYTYYPSTTYSTVSYAPALSRDEIEDRLDDQGYDDIKVGHLEGGYYNVFAEDRDDRKVLLRVEASTGYVVNTQFLR